jgi:hypothetical protein
MKPIGMGRRLTPEQKAEILALRAADPKTWTYVALAAKFGCTDGAAFRVVKLGLGGVRPSPLVLASTLGVTPTAPAKKPTPAPSKPKPAIKPRRGAVSVAEERRLAKNARERARKARIAARR